MTLRYSLSADKKSMRSRLCIKPEIAPRRLSLDAAAELPNLSEDLRKSLIPFSFRILSASFLRGIGIDYSDAEMLKEIVLNRLAENATLMKDHSRSVDDWIGIVGKTEWEEAKDKRPAGVNAVFWIDEVKAAPSQLLRGIELGAVHSCSVSIEFEWEKSHPKMKDSDFFYRLGEVVESDIVRIICKKILRILEVSLVWQGADPDAKIKTDENNFDREPAIIAGSLSYEGGIKDMNLSILAKILGIPENEITEEKLPILLREFAKKEGSKEILEKDAKIQELEANIAIQEKSLAAANENANKLTVLANAGEEYLQSLRGETEKIVKMALGDKTPENVIKSIQSSSDIGQLKTIRDLYAPAAEKNAGDLKCADCGSKNISRQQSQSPAPEGEKKNKTTSAEQQQVKAFADDYFLSGDNNK